MKNKRIESEKYHCPYVGGSYLYTIEIRRILPDRYDLSFTVDLEYPSGGRDLLELHEKTFLSLPDLLVATARAAAEGEKEIDTRLQIGRELAA